MLFSERAISNAISVWSGHHLGSLWLYKKNQKHRLNQEISLVNLKNKAIDCKSIVLIFGFRSCN